MVVWLFVTTKLDLSGMAGFSASLVALAGVLFAIHASRNQGHVLETHGNLLGIIARRLSVEPKLSLRFAGGGEEVTLAADWSEPVSPARHGLFSTTAVLGSTKPLPKGNAPLLFELFNDGDAEASSVSVFITLPEGCEAQEPRSWFALTLNRPWEAQRGLRDAREIRIRGDQLSPGLRVQPGPYVWVVFPRPNETYELMWRAICANRPDPTEGRVLVHVADQSEPSTKMFPGDWDAPLLTEDKP